jgi:hypothetical protein
MSDLWKALLEDFSQRVNSSSEREDISRLQRAVGVAFQSAGSALASEGASSGLPIEEDISISSVAERKRISGVRRGDVRPIDASHETMLHLLSSLPGPRTNKRLRNYLKEILGRNIVGVGGGAASAPAALSWLHSVTPLGYADATNGPNIHLALLEGDLKLDAQFRKVGPYLRSDLAAGNGASSFRNATASGTPMFSDATLHSMETVAYASKFLRWSDHRCSAKHGVVMAVAHSVQRRRLVFVVSDVRFPPQSRMARGNSESHFPIVSVREDKTMSILKKYSDGRSSSAGSKSVALTEFTAVHACEGLDPPAVTEMLVSIKKHLSQWDKHNVPSSKKGVLQTLNILQVLVVLDADGHEMCDGMLRLVGSTLLPRLGQLQDALATALEAKQAEAAAAAPAEAANTAVPKASSPPLRVEFEYEVLIAGGRTLQLACPCPMDATTSSALPPPPSADISVTLRELLTRFPHHTGLVFPSAALFSPHLKGDLHTQIDPATHSTIDVAVCFYPPKPGGTSKMYPPLSQSSRDTLVSLLLSYTGENTTLSIPLARLFFQLWCTTRHPAPLVDSSNSSVQERSAASIEQLLAPLYRQQDAYVVLLHNLTQRVAQLTHGLTATPSFSASSVPSSSAVSIVSADSVSIVISVLLPPSDAGLLLGARSRPQPPSVQVETGGLNGEAESNPLTSLVGANLLALGLSSIFASFGISTKRYEHSVPSSSARGPEVLLGFSPLSDVSDLAHTLPTDLPLLVDQIEMFRTSFWTTIRTLRQSLPQDVADFFAVKFKRCCPTGEDISEQPEDGGGSDGHGNMLPASDAALSTDHPIEERQVFFRAALDARDEEALAEAEHNGELGNAMTISLLNFAVIPKPFLLPMLDEANKQPDAPPLSSDISDAEILARLPLTPDDVLALGRLRRVILRELMASAPNAAAAGAATLSPELIGTWRGTDLEKEILSRVRVSPIPTSRQDVPMMSVGIELDSGSMSHADFKSFCDRVGSLPRLLLDVRTPVGFAIGHWIDEAVSRALSKSDDVMRVQEQVLVQAILTAEKILQGKMGDLVPSNAYRSNSNSSAGGGWFGSFFGWGSNGEGGGGESSGSLRFNIQTAKLTRKIHIPREAEDTSK